jgi:Fur family transcriptional regulator, ferric uptake regulator
MQKESFKLTNQRVIIFDYLKDNYSHPSVEEVYKYVLDKLPRISKKTVYNTIQLLCKKGSIQEVMVKGVQRFEPRLNPHHHLICKGCGKIIDIESEDLLSHAMKVGEKIEDFYVESSSVNFYGFCKKCKGEYKNGTRK